MARDYIPEGDERTADEVAKFGPTSEPPPKPITNESASKPRPKKATAKAAEK